MGEEPETKGQMTPVGEGVGGLQISCQGGEEVQGGQEAKEVPEEEPFLEEEGPVDPYQEAREEDKEDDQMEVWEDQEGASIQGEAASCQEEAYWRVHQAQEGEGACQEAASNRARSAAKAEAFRVLKGRGPAHWWGARPLQCSGVEGGEGVGQAEVEDVLRGAAWVAEGEEEASWWRA